MSVLHLFRAMSVFVMGELCENTFARLKWPKPRTGEAENRYTACESKCWIMGKLWLWQFLQSFCSQELDMFAWAEVLPSIPNSRVVKWRQILDSCVFFFLNFRIPIVWSISPRSWLQAGSARNSWDGPLRCQTQTIRKNMEKGTKCFSMFLNASF